MAHKVCSSKRPVFIANLTTTPTSPEHAFTPSDIHAAGMTLGGIAATGGDLWQV